MHNAALLDHMVSVTSLNHGGASKALSRLRDNEPLVILKNNQPSAIVITPDEYKRYSRLEDDFALYLDSVERLKSDDGSRLSMDDVFGKEYTPVDDGYEPEFE